jgi:hypothetical protein
VGHDELVLGGELGQHSRGAPDVAPLDLGVEWLAAP